MGTDAPARGALVFENRHSTIRIVEQVRMGNSAPASVCLTIRLKDGLPGWLTHIAPPQRSRIAWVGKKADGGRRPARRALDRSSGDLNDRIYLGFGPDANSHCPIQA